MLPTEKLYKTNFIDGIKFNPQQIGLNESCLSSKISIANVYGIGKGVLVGFKGSLELIVDNNNLIVKSGSAIDINGNIIFLDKNYILLKDILVEQFDNRFHIFVYIAYDTQMDNLKPSKYDKDVQIYYNINETSKITLSQKKLRDNELIELGRIYISHQGTQNIQSPINPFEPKDNEINLNYVPKILGENILLNLEDIEHISNALDKYGNFLHEFGFRKNIYSMATIASYSLSISSSIKKSTNNRPWELYSSLKKLLEMSLKIDIERDDIIHTALWKNLIRLKAIFEFSETLKVEYYNPFLNIESSFFSKVILHFNNATIFDGDWENILKEQKKEVVKKDYIIVGSDESCDMIVRGEDIAPKHAKIYIYESGYFIEDLENTSGIYVNAMRVEKGMKKFIRVQDYVALGKNGKILNLQNIPI